MRKINIDFIPPHFNCKNCGECCGPVPISKKEQKAIYDYCIENNVEPINNRDLFTCNFRDNINNKCLIYPVRPILCKLMGVSMGMNCKYGNSYNIDGYKYIVKDIEKDLSNMAKLIKQLRERK